MQYFKGDDLEKKFYDAGKVILEELSLQKDLFFAGAYEAAPLGDMIYETERAPLAKAIDPLIFREAFKEIFDAFTVAGSFESYLTVFRKIFGESVDVTFVIPDPGKLEINIEASELELSEFLSRYIAENQYLFDEIVDDELDNIVFQTVKGFESQYELEQMLRELVPAGVWTEISLTYGA